MSGSETEHDLNELSKQVEAEEFRHLGDTRFAQGDSEDAAAYYLMSLDLYPTAEAHVALAWIIAERGQLTEAIAHCQTAIQIAPEVGNAYNDIGVYLLRQSDAEDDKSVCETLIADATSFLEKAIRADRYDCRNYPFYHLGRIREQAGQFTAARDLYYQSLQIDADFKPAHIAYLRALSWLN